MGTPLIFKAGPEPIDQGLEGTYMYEGCSPSMSDQSHRSLKMQKSNPVW